MTLTRRTAWSSALTGTALLAGCDLTAGQDPAESTASPATDAGPDADADLVDAVVDDVTAALLLVAGVRTREPRLRRDLAGLERMHEGHLAALGATGRTGQDEPAGRDAAAALKLVRRRELTHQRQLVDHAVAARSGQLAGLLASMSAAVAQELSLLPGEPRTGAGR